MNCKKKIREFVLLEKSTPRKLVVVPVYSLKESEECDCIHFHVIILNCLSQWSDKQLV